VLEQSAAFRGGFVVHLAHRLHGEFRLRDEVSRLAIESIALGMLAEASRRTAKPSERPVPAWLRQARALVEAHFAEPLPLADVARRVGVHPVHLARTFRRVHQITFAGYVRHTRVEFARRELAASESPLGDIAVAAGFCDQSHFSRLFKRYTGLTPAEYRLAFQPR
jgi:AraC family transcriptional regulator